MAKIIAIFLIILFENLFESQQQQQQTRKIWLADSIDFPFMIALKFRSLENQNQSFVQEPFCAGSLLNHQWIMTAATCASKIDSNNRPQQQQQQSSDLKPAKAIIGSYRNISFVRLTSIDIDKVIVHPSYDSRTMVNNIGLLHLKNLANVRKDQDFRYEWDDQMTVEQLYDTILMTRLKLMFTYLMNGKEIPDDQCKQIYQKLNVNLPNNSLCYQAKDPIRFHSNLAGGPLVYVNRQRIPMPLGILSFGLQTPDPMVYTAIKPYYDWILTQIN